MFRVVLPLFLVALSTGCGIVALPFHLASIPLQALGGTNVYVVNPESPNPTAQGSILTGSVARIVCTTTGESGTGFLHKSSNILTAAHVVSNCGYTNINVIFSDRTETGISKLVYNRSLDIALLYPSVSLGGRPVVLLSPENTLTIGEQVTFWGFPEGVSGVKPILSTGYVSGLDNDPIYIDADGLKPLNTKLWILNAAINHGNSGSPLLRVADGSIIGIIVRRSSRSPGVGYAAPADAVRRFLRSLDVDP
jgi:S1-C subfamily serine protease